jgi:tagatose-6-phosphate ketose/aldose isomerase
MRSLHHVLFPVCPPFLAVPDRNLKKVCGRSFQVNVVDSGDQWSNPLADNGFARSKVWQQTNLWLTTLDRISKTYAHIQSRRDIAHSRVLVTGTGTSGYAASAIASAWPRAITASASDILIDPERYIHGIDTVISIARSGNAPESLAVIERIHKIRPKIAHWGISCNPEGTMAKSPLIQSIILDPGAHDRNLRMTSSFSCLVLAGISLIDSATARSAVQKASVEVRAKLDTIDKTIEHIARRARSRILLLASSPLFSWAQMGAKNVLEMTAGKFPVVAETYLRLRHDSMSMRSDTLLICLLSSDLSRRRYEEDLICELRARNHGYLAGISITQERTNLFDAIIPPMLPDAADVLRAPFEIIVPQLLGYHLSLRAKLSSASRGPHIVQSTAWYKNTDPRASTRIVH